MLNLKVLGKLYSLPDRENQSMITKYSSIIKIIFREYHETLIYSHPLSPLPPFLL